MKCVEYGSKQNDTIILLHGGGLAPWNYYDEAILLREKYHIIIPILDGHNGSDKDFSTMLLSTFKKWKNLYQIKKIQFI